MRYKWLIGMGVVIIVLALGFGVIVRVNKSRQESGQKVSPILETITKPVTQLKNTSQTNKYAQQLNIKKCEGSGPVSFTHPPMRPEDVAIVLPYGLLAGGHVTPIDHMYFSPKVFSSPPDTYPVYAIADGTIATISFRANNAEGKNAHNAAKKGDYRLDIYYNCTFYSYYDLITSLSPELAAKVPTDTSKSWNEKVTIPIKAGQEIGRIGGQTLDWAVYNADTPLSGFIVPEHYDREPWKIYTDYKSLDYFAEPYKTQFYTLLARQVEPRMGKIDYDIDGKLVGNWFLEGTNGYAGAGSIMQYWDGHLSITPDYIDPTFWHFSTGNWPFDTAQGKGGQATQFGITPTPDPTKVGVETGLVKYELRQSELYNADTNQQWLSNEAPIANPKARLIGDVQGTVLLQLTEPRKLKVEAFPNKSASEVAGFTTNTKNYER